MNRVILNLLDTKSLAQPKILLVEDNQFDQVLIKRLIESYYSYALIDHAELKAEACSYLRRNKYDAVFLDLNLPDTVGLDDIGEIKILAQNTPVIIFTGFYDEAMPNNVKFQGIDGIISKNDLMNTNFSTAIHRAVSNMEKAA